PAGIVPNKPPKATDGYQARGYRLMSPPARIDSPLLSWQLLLAAAAPKFFIRSLLFTTTTFGKPSVINIMMFRAPGRFFLNNSLYPTETAAGIPVKPLQTIVSIIPVPVPEALEYPSAVWKFVAGAAPRLTVSP